MLVLGRIKFVERHGNTLAVVTAKGLFWVPIEPDLAYASRHPDLLFQQALHPHSKAALVRWLWRNDFNSTLQLAGAF